MTVYPVDTYIYYIIGKISGSINSYDMKLMDEKETIEDIKKILKEWNSNKQENNYER